MTRRVLSAQIAHETNTFSIKPTTVDRYKARVYHLGEEAIGRYFKGANAEIAAHMDAAERYGWTLVQPIAAFAQPSGKTPTADFKALLAPLERALADGPYDGVALALHGAMVTEDEEDAEGAVLQLVRDTLGPDVPIALTLDLHGNVSDRMADLSTILIAYRTYPHIDMYEVGRDAMDLLEQAMAGDKALATVVRRPASLDGADHGRTTTPDTCMDRMLKKARTIEAQDPDIDAISIFAGFAWADIHDAGPSVTVTGRAGSPRLVEVAEEFERILWDTRAESSITMTPIEEAMAAAKAGEGADKPLVIADPTDNPGAGSYADHVGILRAMVAAGLENALFVLCVDPETAEAAIAAGVGATLAVTLGSKTDPKLYGPPLEGEAAVEWTGAPSFKNEGPMFAGLEFTIGPSAVLRFGGVRVIVTSNTLQPMDLNLVRATGLDPASFSTIVVKSMQHFRAAYAPIAREILFVDSGALSSPNLKIFPYENVRRPIYPLDLG